MSGPSGPAGPAEGAFLPRLVHAGLLTGVVDGLFSSALSEFAYGGSAARLFRGVAAVPFGERALEGGAHFVALGVLLHFGVAFAWSAAFLALLSRSATVRGLRSSRFGVAKLAALYGPFIWLVMSLAVIPLFTHELPAITARWWVQFFGHIPFVAVPIVVASAPRPR